MTVHLMSPPPEPGQSVRSQGGITQSKKHDACVLPFLGPLSTQEPKGSLGAMTGSLASGGVSPSLHVETFSVNIYSYPFLSGWRAPQSFPSRKPSSSCFVLSEALDHSVRISTFTSTNCPWSDGAITEFQDVFRTAHQAYG